MAYHEKNIHTMGFNDFIICAGYNSNMIKEYGFLIIICIIATLLFDFTDNNRMIIHNNMLRRVMESYYCRYEAEYYDGGALREFSHI